MAQQITIDIVAETKKLTSGINDANNQIEGMNGKLKGVVAAAGAAASAFVLREGVTFLKQGIDEAKEAKEVMTAATTTFGEGSAALAKITEDAARFGKEIAVDNDEILKLSTQLGSRLPADAKALSAELINTAYDVEAYTAGAISAESVSTKLAKAFADGVLKSKELQKIFPDLSAATYEQAEALSAAGKNQEALTLLNDAAQKKYGDAAEKNVTSTQKFETALANLKESVGTKILPIVEKFVNALTTLIDKFDNLPGPVQNLILALTGVVAIGGPLLTFLASAKTAMVTLGIVNTATAGTTTAATVATNLFSLALRALPILAIIALIVLFVKNWDTIKEVVDKVLDAVVNFGKGAWEELKNFVGKIPGFIKNIALAFNPLGFLMTDLGKDMLRGLWNGISSMASWLKTRVFDFFGNLIPGWAKKMLGISSPSKVFAEFGKQIVEGLALGIGTAESLARNATFNLGNTAISGFSPQLASSGISQPPVQITINAGLGTDPYVLGREVNNALTKYGRVSSKVAR